MKCSQVTVHNPSNLHLHRNNPIISIITVMKTIYQYYFISCSAVVITTMYEKEALLLLLALLVCFICHAAHVINT